MGPKQTSMVRVKEKHSKHKRQVICFPKFTSTKEGYVSVEFPTKGRLSQRATCLTQFTTKVNWCSLRISTKERVK
jgi:hypothetical protein